jgi:hypothetical protein
MRLRFVLPIILPVIVVAGWLLYENPERDVRNAHEVPVRLVSKSDGCLPSFSSPTID